MKQKFSILMLCVVIGVGVSLNLAFASERFNHLAGLQLETHPTTPSQSTNPTNTSQPVSTTNPAVPSATTKQANPKATNPATQTQKTKTTTTTAASKGGGKCGMLGTIFQQASPSLGDDAISIFPSNLCNASDFLVRILNILFSFAAGVATLAIVIGGFMYFGAAGNPESATKGRQVIQNAVIGLAVIMLSFTIVNLAARFLQDGTSGGTESSDVTNPGGGSPVSPDPGNTNPGTTPSNAPQVLKISSGSLNKFITPDVSNKFDPSMTDSTSSIAMQVMDTGNDYTFTVRAIQRTCTVKKTSGSNTGDCSQSDVSASYCSALSITIYDTMHPRGYKASGFTVAEPITDKSLPTICKLLSTFKVAKSSLVPATISANNKILYKNDVDTIGDTTYGLYAASYSESIDNPVGVGPAVTYFGQGIIFADLTN